MTRRCSSDILPILRGLKSLELEGGAAEPIVSCGSGKYLVGERDLFNGCGEESMVVMVSRESICLFEQKEITGKKSGWFCRVDTLPLLHF